MKFFVCFLVFAYLAIDVFADDSNADNESYDTITTKDKGHPDIPSTRSGKVKTGYVYPKIDHFGTGNETFKMRYLFNEEFCLVDNCPLIIYVGGEWTITPGWLEKGQIYEMAQENGAALFSTEHRFYGETQPTDLSIKNLFLLNSEQAIEDLRHFINYLKGLSFYSKSKIALFGCSYSASLTTWTKVLYPDLVNAIYATSGPMKAKENMFEYLVKTSQVIKDNNEPCYEAIKNGIQEMKELYDQSGGATQVRTLLGICEPNYPNEPYDKAVLFDSIAATFGNIVQSKFSKLDEECEDLLSSSGESDMERLASYQNSDGSDCSRNDYHNQVKYYQDADVSSGDRQWLFQQCNEFGFFQTTDSDEQIFGKSVKTNYYEQLCKDAYTQGFTKETMQTAIDKTNSNYGGKHPNVHNAVFVYGDIDPWAPMGLDGSLSSDAIVFNPKQGGHCMDMFKESSSDSESMISTKQKTRAWIKKWLQ